MKILLFDLETAPNLGYTWGKWEQNVIEFKDDWYILCFAWKWLDESDMHYHKLPDFPTFATDKLNDRALVRKLWELFNEADAVIAHNAWGFDVRKANARFIVHKLRPPSPYKVIDTKKIAKRYFRFDSNKLDELGRYLGVGRKHRHTGFELWLNCMSGKESAWKEMERYNRQDVVLLEKVYLKLRGWMNDHPNHNFFDFTKDNCPTCGSEKLQARGIVKTLTSEYKRYYCSSCGAWSRGNLTRTFKVERRTHP